MRSGLRPALLKPAALTVTPPSDPLLLIIAVVVELYFVLFI